MQNVLIADDGELLLIREMLSELDVPYRDQNAQPDGDRSAVDLLITNPRLALSDNGPPAQFHLVVYEEVSRTLRKALGRTSCNLALQSPLDPAVFRTIVDHALYQGPERRRTRRAVLWAEVDVKSGLRQTRATLGQLSLQGCSLVLDRALKEGSSLWLTLPQEITGAKPLRLGGSVLRSTPVCNEHGSQEVSVKFRELVQKDLRQLQRIVGQHAGRERKPTPIKAPEPVVERPLGADRRKNARARFASEILANSPQGSQVLLGCDLSAGGMRVQSDATLAVGDELKLALYARMGLPSVMVKAIVARADPDGSFGLRFDKVTDAVAARLEQIVSALPPLVDARQAKPGVVVSQVLERLGSKDDSP